MSLNLFGEEIKTPYEEEGATNLKGHLPKLFDWIGSITDTKQDLRAVDPSLTSFEPFIVLTGLMQDQRLVGFANIMNRMPQIPKESQYVFLQTGIPKCRSRARWSKKTKNELVAPLVDKYRISKREAEEICYIFDEDQIKAMLADPNSKSRKRKK